jgi:murein DD-endopeptidase MepM/ murein hydrolase activator NlpD
MKRFNENFRISKNSFKNFISKNNFYVVLGICVLIVGATAVFVSMQNIPLPEDKYSLENPSPTKEQSLNPPDSSAVDNSQSVNTVDSSISTEDASTATKDTNKATENTSKATVNNNGSTLQTVSFVAPIMGEILTNQSLDKPVYSVTFADWRTHKGIDISANSGTAVKNAATGTVAEIKNDFAMGKTVIVDNGAGYKSIYSNLGDCSLMTVGKELKQGDVIGSVGNTAIYESSDAPHLHFEITKNDVAVDPVQMIKYFENNTSKK